MGINEEKVVRISEDIRQGKRIQRGDEIEYLKDCELSVLMEQADELRKYFVGDGVDLCTIIAGKSGNCGENCKFCAQSGHHHTSCEVYGLMDFDQIYAEARNNEKEGVDRFAIVISGHHPSEKDFDSIIETYKKLYEKLHISLCASLGFLTSEQFERLYAAGVRSYHNNIETSRGYFPSICTTHTFEDKIANIKRAKAAGLKVCSGGIIGMGEKMDDRIEMAFDLQELGVGSIPINTLIPIPGTPLENVTQLKEDEILRTIAIFRMINPEADIRLGAGRKLIEGDGRKAFFGGASATITGNMLTTSGSTIAGDRKMLLQMGREICES